MPARPFRRLAIAASLFATAAAGAHALMETNQHIGKIVLTW